MPLAPAAKALIIVSSLCVAAGVALYESEHAREDILEWWAEVRHKTRETWDDIVRDLTERFNMTPEERRARAREIILMAGGIGRTATGAASGVRGDERQPDAAEAGRRRRRELFELARGSSSGVDQVPERALRAGAIINESTAARRRTTTNLVDPKVDSSHIKAVSGDSLDTTTLASGAVAGLGAGTAISEMSEIDETKSNIDDFYGNDIDDGASTTTTSFSHIYTPTSSLSEFGDDEKTQEEYESARSGNVSPSTLSLSSSAMTLPSEDELSDAGTEILGERELLLDNENNNNDDINDDVRSVSSVTSGRSAWTDVSRATSSAEP